MANRKTNYYFVRMVMFNGDRPTLCKRHHAYTFCSLNDIKQFNDLPTAKTIAETQSQFANVAKAQVFFQGKKANEYALICEVTNPNYDYFKMLSEMQKNSIKV